MSKSNAKKRATRLKVKSTLDDLPESVKEKLRAKNEPEWIDPMLATLIDGPFSSDEWIFERKLDGERCLAFKLDHEIRLMSRNKRILNDEYPELMKAFSDQKGRFVVDGEIVAFQDGKSSFARLQDRMHLKDLEEIKERREKIPAYYYLFDILYLDGYDLTHLYLEDRKAILKRAIKFRDPLRFSEHTDEEGKEFFRKTCKEGREGVVAKRLKSVYEGRRSEEWLKIKCIHEQEFVVGGYTDPKGKRIVLGALLIGYYDDGDLKYAGKVGTGFDRENLRCLQGKLRNLSEDKQPFDGKKIKVHDVHWVKPRLVAQIKFSEWTKDGKLRHPVYLGLRDDKGPKEVKKEMPKKR